MTVVRHLLTTWKVFVLIAAEPKTKNEKKNLFFSFKFKFQAVISIVEYCWTGRVSVPCWLCQLAHTKEFIQCGVLTNGHEQRARAHTIASWPAAKFKLDACVRRLFVSPGLDTSISADTLLRNMKYLSMTSLCPFRPRRTRFVLFLLFIACLRGEWHCSQQNKKYSERGGWCEHARSSILDGETGGATSSPGSKPSSIFRLNSVLFASTVPSKSHIYLFFSSILGSPARWAQCAALVEWILWHLSLIRI